MEGVELVPEGAVRLHVRPTRPGDGERWTPPTLHELEAVFGLACTHQTGDYAFLVVSDLLWLCVVKDGAWHYCGPFRMGRAR